MKSGLANIFGLISVVGSVAALPQASVTLWDFGISSGTVFGTEWAEPIGTASDGSVTTFIIENVQSGILSSSIITTETFGETVMVSASGWDRIGPVTNIDGATTVIVTGVQCSFTDSTSGVCVEEGNLNNGPALTETTTGPASAMTFAISTGVLPGATTTAVGQTTVSVLPTTSSFSQSTFTTVPTPTTASPGSTPVNSSTTSSNVASSMRVMKGRWNVGALAAVGGMLLGTSILLL